MPAGSRIIAAALLGAALVAAGCGTAANDDEVARGTVSAFLDTCGHDEGRLAQQLVTTPAQQVFVDAPGTAAGCARILGAPDGTDLTTARIDALSVDDGAGTATITVGGARHAIDLTFGRSGWQIDGPH